MTQGDGYLYKGKHYKFVRAGKMKNPDTGEWESSISYESEDGTEFYTTTVARFSKFQPIAQNYKNRA